MEAEDPSEFFASLVWDGGGPPPSEEDVDEPILKKCAKCQDLKPLEYYHKDIGKKDGLCSYCKPCNITNAANYQKKRRVETEDPSETPEQVHDVEPCKDTGADSLYIMSNSLLPDIVKIGRSSNPEERAKQLGASHPFRLRVECSYGGKGFLEKSVHDRLKHRRVEGGLGREWYRLKAEQADTLIRASIVDHELTSRDDQ